MTNNSLSDRDRELAVAIRHHMEGEYDQAERIYLRLHGNDQRDEEVLYLLGILCCDLGIFLQACRFLKRALEISPGFPEAAQRLAIALKGLAEQEIGSGKLDEAATHLQHALILDPNNGQLLKGLGRVALLRGDAALAESLLAQSLRELGQNIEALNWHGLACLRQKKYSMADQSLRQAIAIDPQLGQARNNLGISLFEQGRVEQARECFSAALQQDPTYANARTNLANMLRILGQPHAALQHIELLLAETPNSVELLNNLGTVLQDMGLASQARECLERASAISPASPHVRWNLALSQLALGDYQAGWTNFEARWQGCPNLHGAYDKPHDQAWQGETLQGKRILLWSEQGFGDTLQFIRFAANLARMGAIVSAEVQPELSALISRAPGITTVVARGQTLPPYDFHCPMMSLPYRLGVSLADLIGPPGYLSADTTGTLRWKEKLTAYPGCKVGLAWAGKSRIGNAELAAIDARRSIKLRQFAPVLRLKHSHFFSLQKGAAAAELSECSLPIQDFSAEWTDFSDTAAFIANLDLVITVDTAVAHLAGALGKPVWLLNRYDSCWRWLLDRIDSPWYPTLRQFRQECPGEWERPIAMLLAEMERWVGDRIDDHFPSTPD